MEHDYRDVLLKAASYVEQGWCQNAQALDSRGDEWSIIDLNEERKRPDRVCLEGALELAALDLGVQDPVRHKAFRTVRQTLGYTFIFEWNDTEGRTADEVAEALREAADA